MQDQPVIFAQISDLHIGPPGRLAYGRVDTAALLRTAVQQLNALDPAPHAVLVTGDLADHDPRAYDHLLEILRELKHRFFVIPGNHDHIPSFLAAFADHGYLPVGGEFVQFAVEEFPVRIVAVDSVVRGRVRGMLCSERLAWLDRTLAQRPRTPTVVMMHHAPFVSGLAHYDDCGMDGVDGLEQVIRRHGQVERILCGHVHRAIQTRFGGTLASSCPSTAHQVGLDLRLDGWEGFTLEPPGFQIHRWNGRALYTYSVNVGTFEGPFPFH